jgi:hypothetical protein
LWTQLTPRTMILHFHNLITTRPSIRSLFFFIVGTRGSEETAFGVTSTMLYGILEVTSVLLAKAKCANFPNKSRYKMATSTPQKTHVCILCCFSGVRGRKNTQVLWSEVEIKSKLKGEIKKNIQDLQTMSRTLWTWMQVCALLFVFSSSIPKRYWKILYNAFIVRRNGVFCLVFCLFLFCFFFFKKNFLFTEISSITLALIG